MMRGRTVAGGIELAVVPGSRQIRQLAAASGALDALREAGARILDGERRLAPGSRHGSVLLCGASPRAAGRSRSVFRVSAATARASALAGRIADPRERPLPAATVVERLPAADATLVRPAADPEGAALVRGASIRPVPAAPPIVATLRGVVLLELPDRFATDALLPAGPRVWRHRSDLAALAGHLYAGIDPGFARRARAHGGGFVVAGSDYGIGPPQPHALLALIQLGVRAVIAASFAEAHRAEMVRYGVLPLRSDGHPSRLRRGDELEIPGLPDGLERGKPLVMRNLTRGTQISLHHGLNDREIEIVRAGGLLYAGLASGIPR
jgi:aconitate hydratase